MAFSNHSYHWLHAVTATIVMMVAMFSNGFSAFLRQFLYGQTQVMTPELLKINMLASVGLFGTLALVLWGSTVIPKFRFKKRKLSDFDTNHITNEQLNNYPNKGKFRWQGILYALKVAPFITAIALILNICSVALVQHFTGIKLADQDLIRCFTEGSYSFWLKSLVIIMVLFEAPILEELLFRNIIFRGYTTLFKPTVAMLVSGFVFAFMHVNAASLIPIWFLGTSFAYLYYKTQTLWAPITAHIIFNSFNLILLVFVPDIVK